MEGSMLNLRINKCDVGYLRLLIDLATIEIKKNKKKSKNSKIN